MYNARASLWLVNAAASLVNFHGDSKQRPVSASARARGEEITRTLCLYERLSRAGIALEFLVSAAPGRTTS